MEDFKKISEEEWRRKLTPEQYHILRESGTESPFTGKYYKTEDEGVYRCLACGQELFSSKTKFDSGSGWPSFYQPLSPAALEMIEDNNHGMMRTEVKCARCGGHLGHLFDDGPPPTGRRFCINSGVLDLVLAEPPK